MTAQYAEVLRAMAAQLADAERPGATARRAGRRWGTAILKRHPGNLSARADPVEVAAELLAAQGFGPRIVGRHDRYDGGDRYEPYDGGYRYDRGEAGAADREIVLRTCPFLELAAEQPDVMCQLHQGMLAEVLAATGATARLIPFADEWGCRVLIDAVSQDRTGSPPGLLERDRQDHPPPSVEGGAHCAQKPRDPPYQSP